MRSFAGLAGPRLPLAVAGFAALASSTALAVGALWNAFSEGAGAPEDVLADHQAAAEQALGAIDEARAELESSHASARSARERAAHRRARELARVATARTAEGRRKTGAAHLALPPSLRPASGEHLGLIDRAHNRILTFEGTGIVDGATLSTSLPMLASAKAGPYTVDDGGSVFAVGAPIDGDLFVIARVDVARAGPSTEALDRARRLIGDLAAPAIPRSGSTDPSLLLLIAALLAAAGAGTWAYLRVTRPIARALDVGREFVHGRTEVRADPNLGGREAREVAGAINAMIDRADRALEKGRAARGDDLQNAVLAIDRLGKGDLRDGIVPPGPIFGPIAQAIDRARRDLLERVTEMHHAAMQVATRASEIAPAARQISESSTEQLSALRRLSTVSEEGVEEIRRKATELEVSVNALSATAQEHRDAIQEVRASLSGLSRRVMALRGTAEEAQALGSRAESVDQALSMLSRLAGQSDVPATKARATALVGDARGALSEISEKLGSLEQEMLRAAHGLEILAQAQPEPPAMLDASVTQPFYDASSILVRTIELTVACLASLERSAKTGAESGEAMQVAARQAVDLVPRLGTALSAIRLGTSFEEQLLERLERMKAEVEAARRTDGLTPEGQQMLSDVIEASETARAKLARLAQATEAAIRAMRG